MNRIIITEARNVWGDKSTGTKWFDADRAERFGEDTRWDGRNNISVATNSQTEHESLYRTAGGRWILCEWSDWEGTRTTYTEIPKERADDWLLKNDHEIPESELAAREV